MTMEGKQGILRGMGCSPFKKLPAFKPSKKIVYYEN
jgi:hypothetical protein